MNLTASGVGIVQTISVICMNAWTLLLIIEHTWQTVISLIFHIKGVDVQSIYSLVSIKAWPWPCVPRSWPWPWPPQSGLGRKVLTGLDVLTS